MISDRQNTYFEDLTREPIDKILELPNFNSVLGFAGTTQMCRHLIDQLRAITTPVAFEQNYGEVFRECCGRTELGFRSDDIELLVVSNHQPENGFIVRKVLGGIMSKIDYRKCHAIGGGTKYIIPQLQLDTLTINGEEAKEFGLTLLKFASLIDISVGDPITYGYNVATITTTNIRIQTLTPETVNISKLLYNFER